MRTGAVRPFILAVMCASTALSCLADGKAKQSIDSIRKAAEQFVRSQPQVKRLDSATVDAGRLDPRLSLPLCDQPLQVFLPPGGKLMGKSNVGVRCTGSSPWTLYVPVTITAYANVATTNHGIQRGTLLSKEDFSLVQQPLHQLPAGYLQDPEQLVGMEMKRTVSAGRPLTRNMVKPPTLVKRGQQVTLIAQNPHFEVRMSGKALANGAAGDRIRVQNLSSKKVVEGTIDDQGAVLVDP